MKKALVLLPLLGLASLAGAQTVALTGMLGGKALIIVDGGAPKSVAPGASHQGIKIVATQGDEAVIEIKGHRQTMRVGDTPIRIENPAFKPGAGATKLC